MIRYYQKGDIDKIKIQQEQKRESLEEEYFDNEDTFVFVDKDTVLAIVRPYYEIGGRIYLSALISADCGYKGFSMVKEMRKIVDDWLNDDDNMRIEFITQADWKQANRLAKILGFSCEGRMRKYYNGIDFNIWGKVK